MVESNINEFMSRYKGYVNGVVVGTNKGTEEIIKKAENDLKSRCANVNLGEHLGNIQTHIDENTGVISTTDEVIIYKEMGTGVVGSSNPHPNPSSEFANWKYDINEHGESGWVYPKKDGTYGRTKGIPSSHMFYDTYLDLKDSSSDTIRVEINKNTKGMY